MRSLKDIQILKQPLRAVTTVLVASALSLSCTKGGSISSSSSSTVGNGLLLITKVYPTPSGPAWTTITASNRIYIKGLQLTITGTCSRGIDHIQVDEGAGVYPEQAACADDGSFTFNKTYTAITGEGDKTLHLIAYDVSNNAISGASVNQDLRIDATAPALPVVTTPAVTPYTFTGNAATFVISGTCAADVVKLTGPAGVVITPSGTNWTYTASLVDGASLSFTFYSYDLAGNQSPGVTQVINYTPSVALLAGGILSGGMQNDASSGFKMESTQYILPAQSTDGATSYGIQTGFNYLINTVRAQ